jgi:protein TonB
VKIAGHELERDRAGGVAATALVHLLLGLALLWGLGAPMPRALDAPLKLFNVVPPPPEPDPPPRRPPPRVESDTRAQRFASREEGGASPPNLRSQATEVVAPRPQIPLPVPSPIVAAPYAGTGSDATSGAADIRGPGKGSGGEGDGSGSGAGGGGDGGGGYGRMTPPRLIRGRLRNSDYPPGLGEAGVGGTVSVRYTVLTDGSVVDCRITRSSGSRELDLTTCRLIEARFRYDPSRDGRGRPIVSHIVENHSWIVDDLPPDPEEPPRRRRRLF